jgi:DNA polymerase-3 subunit gamma/tau
MSYLVLARKYRPKTFTQLVGQSHVVQALTNALRSQRLHHAYLFTGTRGVGKTTVSRILAKSLNCETGITDEPCGVCSACVDIDAGRFVDYTELDAASNRGVDEVQQLLEQAAYKPVQGRFKVFMIDEVHMLSNTAFNAMLKTLEEPPEYLKFVLATTDPHKVPVTVLSRCLQFNLRPMAPETIVEHLTQVLADEKVQADVQSLRLLARAARGSMRDALSLTDQAIAFGNGTLAEAVVRDMLGSVDRSHVFTLIEALAHGDGALVVQTCESLRHLGLSASSLLEEMGMVLQRMAVHQATAQTAASDDPDPDVKRIADLSHLMPADETQLLYSICLHGRADLGLAPDEYAALTMVLLRLLAFKPVHAEAEKKTLKTAPEPVKDTLLTSGSDLGEQWLSVVQDMVKAQLIQAMTRELAMQSQLMEQADGVWHLQVESESLKSASNRERLQLALQSLGHAVTLQVAQGPVQDSPARRITALQQQRMSQAQADILNHPSVQRLINEYDAKIIPGTLRLLDH